MFQATYVLDDPSVTLSNIANVTVDDKYQRDDDKHLRDDQRDVISQAHRVHGTVDEQVARIRSSMHRRKIESEKDKNRFVIVENKVFSGKLANIAGLQTHLRHTNQAKIAYQQQLVEDEW
jgi:hypothetical protein